MAKIQIEMLTGTAVSLVDESGYEALTLSAIAGALDVAPSALYTHCRGLDGLRALVAEAASDNLAAEVRTAAIGNAGEHAVVAIGQAYRRFALDHPGQFAALLRSPESPGGRDAAGQAVIDVFALVFSAMGLSVRQSAMAARSTHSAIHGFLALEHVSGTDDEHADDYVDLLRTLQRVIDAGDRSEGAAG